VSSEDQRLGELIGEVRGLSKAVDQMHQSNDSDHASVIARLDRGEERFDRIEQKLDDKMPKEWGQKFHERLTGVEKEQAEEKGRRAWKTAIVVGVALPVIAGILLLIATGVISG
jgi:hypothetical protein